MNLSKSFLLPGDEPVSAPMLKRHILFSDNVLVAAPKDKAIINDNELIERFPSMAVNWPARGHYPRVNDYEERFYRCLQGADEAMRKGLIISIDSRAIGIIDPGSHWVFHNTLTADPDLVKAAAPDATPQLPAINIPETITRGSEISQQGFSSKYSVPYKEAAEIAGVPKEWTALAHLRLGRAVKFIRLAHACGAAPIAVDSANSQIALALSKRVTPELSTTEMLPDLCLNADLIDHEKLETVLADASWKDVIKMRKETLSHANRLKHYLHEQTVKLSRGQPSIDDYVRFVREMRSEYHSLKEQEAEALAQLRIGSVFKSAVAAGSVAVGTVVIAVPATFYAGLVALAGAGLVAVGSLGDEFKSLIPARRKVREHPLFFIEGLGGVPRQ